MEIGARFPASSSPPQRPSAAPSAKGGAALSAGEAGAQAAVPGGGASPDRQRVPDDPRSRGGGPVRKLDAYECRTCENRKYQDGSNDPGVSYKTPTRIDPQSAAGAVRSHEMEHVTHEQGKARREGREVVSQTVTMHTGICPECGRVYVSGGTTRTVTREQQDRAALFSAGTEQPGAAPRFSATA